MAPQRSFDPRPGRTRAGLAPQRCELLPEVHAHGRVAARAPRGARVSSTPALALDGEDLLRDDARHSVVADARELPDGGAAVAARERRQPGLEALAVARRLGVRIRVFPWRVEAVEPAPDWREGAPPAHGAVLLGRGGERGAGVAQGAGEPGELTRPIGMREVAAGVGVRAEQQQRVEAAEASRWAKSTIPEVSYCVW